MGNPILEQLDRRNLQTQAPSNHVFQQLADYVNQHGGDPKTAFLNLCMERGVNPNDVLNLAKSKRRK